MHASNTSILEDMMLLWLVRVRRCGASSSNDECLPNECVRLPMRWHMRMMCFGERLMQWFRMIDFWTLVWCIIIEWWMLAQRMCPQLPMLKHADRLISCWRNHSGWSIVGLWCGASFRNECLPNGCVQLPMLKHADRLIAQRICHFHGSGWSIAGLWCGASLRNECLPNGHVQHPMRKHVDHWWVHSGASHHHDGTPAWWCRNWATNSGVAHHHQMMNACPTDLSLSWLRMIDFWTLVWCIMTKWMLAQRICPELIMKQNPCPTDVPITHIHLGYIWWHSHRMCSSPNAEHTLIMWSVALGVMSS